jgi:uncharacterized membrane protein
VRTESLERRGRAAHAALPRGSSCYLRTWVLLGIPAFASLVVVFCLMVAKP